MQLDLERCGVRSFRDADATAIALHANNQRVWLQLRDRFPHPYTIDDAREFLRFARGDDPETAFAITVNDLPVGSIGVVLRDDVERCSTEIGYWLEGRMRRSAMKDGIVQDQLLYAILQGEAALGNAGLETGAP